MTRLRKNTTLTLPDRTRRRLANHQTTTGLSWSRIVELAVDEWEPVIDADKIATRGGAMLAAARREE